ncbi:hypothetical protein CJ030_MR2G005742 [Morella rubra]|uniref:MULE transposase domain-containing protein n=1 Tax=Morella rubra TaxID=262757 RepID=A0A6A1WG43_9ROSI|nr:hypothetical protein CJ030_MR3G005747 [Morella rubra]KAB1224225.1 hypothetical protein CJ030_MR2G005742 [Morella rubra]
MTIMMKQRPMKTSGGPSVGLGGHSFEVGGPLSGPVEDTDVVDRDEEHMTTDMANDEHVTTQVGDDAPSTHPESVDDGYLSDQVISDTLISPHESEDEVDRPSRTAPEFHERALRSSPNLFGWLLLEGGFKGQLLSTVARDPNNNMYLVAFVVVEAELKDNWELFLETLVGDLGSAPPRGWTFMSDRQKGLAQDFKAVIPMVDHRFCVKHLYANFRDANHRGVALKDKLWCAATAYTESESNKKMDELKALSPNAHEYLRKVDYT